MSQTNPTTAEARFWIRVQKSPDPDGCWLWCGGVGYYGYGRFVLPGGQMVQAHRFSWELAHGPIPDGLWALHNCPTGDNPACVNPAHLFLGTHADNMADMAQKGRLAYGNRNGAHQHPERRPKGESHGSVKLTAAQVTGIRYRYARGGITMQQMATEYGVTRTNISSIIHRQTWKHVEAPSRSDPTDVSRP